MRRRLRERLSSRGLEFVGSFLPQHFSRAEKADEDRAWLRENLRLVRDGSPAGSQPLAILSRPVRRAGPAAFSGRIAEHPETWLSAARFDDADGQPPSRRRAVPRRGASSRSSIRTPARTSRRPTRSPGSWTGSTRRSSGLCLDTGHFRFGGADPGPGGPRLPRPRPPRPHQGLQDVGHGRGRRRRARASRRRSSAACSARSARATSASTAVIDGAARATTTRLAGRRAGPGARAERHAGVGRRRSALQPRVPAPLRELSVAAALTARRLRVVSRPRARQAGSRTRAGTTRVASTTRSTSASVWAPVRKPRIM